MVNFRLEAVLLADPLIFEFFDSRTELGFAESKLHEDIKDFLDPKELNDPKSLEVAEKAIEAMKVEEPKTFTFTLKKNVDAKKAEQVKKNSKSY